MKKNAMLKIAAILMVAVLLTTCAISSTFAKYTTSATSAVEGARVARFGVYLTTSLDGLFDENYEVHSNETTITGNSVESAVSIGGNLVAPGTSGEVSVTGTVEGTPEVAVKLETSATLALTGWSDEDGDEYCPLIFTVDGVDYYMHKMDNSVDVIPTIDALKTAVINAIADAGTAEYAANTDLSGVAETTFDIAWRWDYEVGATTLLNGYQNDVDDTYLGNKVVGKGVSGQPGYVAPQEVSIAFTITQTITQID